jgi:DNA-binding XRE family transcriptional regulator
MLRISLKSARINAGLKQKEAAVALGVSRKTVAAWENGKAMPSVDKVTPICNLYGVTYDNIRWTN